MDEQPQQPQQYPQTPQPQYPQAPYGPPQSSRNSSAPEHSENPNFMGDDPASAVVTPPSRGHRKLKKFFFWLLIFLLIAGVGVGAYYYQQQKLDQTNQSQAALKSQVSALQTQLNESKSKGTKSTTKPSVSAASATQVLNGQVNSTKVPGKVTVQTLFIPGQVSEIWLEYGSSPTSFTKATAHASNGLEQSTGGDYAVHEWQINTDQFQAGSTYYYRSAAKVSGTTVYSAPAAFVQP
jgi:hypothetical protein